MAHLLHRLACESLHGHDGRRVFTNESAAMPEHTAKDGAASSCVALAPKYGDDIQRAVADLVQDVVESGVVGVIAAAPSPTRAAGTAPGCREEDKSGLAKSLVSTICQTSDIAKNVTD